MAFRRPGVRVPPAPPPTSRQLAARLSSEPTSSATASAGTWSVPPPPRVPRHPARQAVRAPPSGVRPTACVAGFIAGASMPLAAESRTGFSRWIHVKMGEFAILFVIGVTLFSLSIQAWILGFQASTLAYHLQISDLRLILSVLPQ